MGVSKNVCGRGLLGVTPVKSYIPRTERHSTFGVMLLCLGNVTIIWITINIYCMSIIVVQN